MEWDIVQRLREGRTNGSNLVWGVSDIHREAADEIERLREVLQSIACTDADCSAVKPFECPIDNCTHGKARAALGHASTDLPDRWDD